MYIKDKDYFYLHLKVPFSAKFILPVFSDSNMYLQPVNQRPRNKESSSSFCSLQFSDCMC